MKNTYSIDCELVKLRNLHLPNNPLLIAIINAYLSFLPGNVKKSSVEYHEWKNGNIKMHMFIPRTLKDKVTPCLFYIHGGGFVFRATDVQYHYEQQYALNCNCRVIGIDYHRLPKHTYPVAVNECIDAYRYIVEQASSLRIDADKIAVGGDSAGGLLSLETYFHLKETEIKQPNGLMLIYPVADHTSSTESIRKYTDTPVWDGKANKVFWKKYLDGQEYTSPPAFTLQSKDETRHIPVFVPTCVYFTVKRRDKAYSRFRLDSRVLMKTSSKSHLNLRKFSAERIRLMI